MVPWGVLPRLFGLPSYAVMMASGYAVALAVVLWLAPRRRVGDEGLDRGQIFDLFVVMLISSLLGAKIGHTLFEAPGHKTADGRTIHTLVELLREDPWHWLRLGEGGYVWYGGMVGALAVAVWYFRSRPHLNALLYADAFAPAVMVGAAIGRVGCFMEGCCHGVPTSVPWAVTFDPAHGPVHPTQLYDSTFAAVCGGGPDLEVRSTSIRRREHRLAADRLPGGSVHHRDLPGGRGARELRPVLHVPVDLAGGGGGGSVGPSLGFGPRG